MKQKKSKLIQAIIVMMLIIITGFQFAIAEKTSDTELQISDIKGGLAQVSFDIKNIGLEIAENITSSISVTGGLLNKINVYHECSGCSSCGSTLDPGAIKTESTIESGLILGFGPITIDISADASNSDGISKTANGFVIGFIVIIQ